MDNKVNEVKGFSSRNSIVLSYHMDGDLSKIWLRVLVGPKGARSYRFSGAAATSLEFFSCFFKVNQEESHSCTFKAKDDLEPELTELVA